MAGADDEDHLLRIEVLEEEAGHLLGRGQPADDQVELAKAQLVEQHRVLASDDLDAAGRVLLQKQPHGDRHDPRRDRRQRADADRRRGRVARAGDGIDALPDGA